MLQPTGWEGLYLTELALDGALVLRTLARQPSREEIATCLDHVRDAGSRTEAFEDIQWSLINSTEFLHRN